MPTVMLWIVQAGTLVFIFAGLFTLWAFFTKKEEQQRYSLLLLSLLGPCILGLCWLTQEEFRHQDAVFWGRLMAGDVSKIWGIGSLGIILGSGLALGALSLRDKKLFVIAGALFFAFSWIVFYLHPTPHYVPMPPWLDKLIWFGLTVGGATASLYVFFTLKEKLKFLQAPILLMAGGLSLLAIAALASQEMAKPEIQFADLNAEQRIKNPGCLSCHTMNNVGYEDPGGSLESVASRSEDTLRAFLINPDAQTAQELGIRENPTGEMAGVKLTEEQVNHITEALVELFEVKPPSMLGPGTEEISAIFQEKTCLACHTVKGEGAPQGGLGGPIEQATHLTHETLVDWLMEPSAAKAQELGITDAPMGAMEPFALEEENAEIIASWIKTLE